MTFWKWYGLCVWCVTMGPSMAEGTDPLEKGPAPQTGATTPCPSSLASTGQGTPGTTSFVGTRTQDSGACAKKPLSTESTETQGTAFPEKQADHVSGEDTPQRAG